MALVPKPKITHVMKRQPNMIETLKNSLLRKELSLVNLVR